MAKIYQASNIRQICILNFYSYKLQEGFPVLKPFLNPFEKSEKIKTSEVTSQPGDLKSI